MRIIGFLVGPGWLPSSEQYKPLSYDCLGMEPIYSEPVGLREHVLRATDDDDFPYCEIAKGQLQITIDIERGGNIYQRLRSFDLTRFPSIADQLRLDWIEPLDELDEATP